MAASPAGPFATWLLAIVVKTREKSDYDSYKDEE
jgi:hypothetical protein